MEVTMQSSPSRQPSIRGQSNGHSNTAPLLLSLYELVSWTGMTVFELWIHMVAILFSTIFLAFKEYHIFDLTFWEVFYPLFGACAFDGYFLFIVFIRSIVEYKDCKGPLLRFGFNCVRLFLLASFEVILCYKIEGDLEQGQVAVRSSYGVIFTPVWLILAGLCSQICRLF